jgi:ankyrin repeat protein
VLTENPEVISLLLRAGADPDLRDDYGKTALDYARKNELLQGTDALKALKAARYQ